jgi:hypothetical protein
MTSPPPASAATCLTSHTCLNSQNSLSPGTFQDQLQITHVTLQLNAGVPAPEVARRAGHGVAVLLRVYAGCIAGHEQIWNDRIEDALRDEDTQ